ncbi:MAG: cation-translocating P-type ATPase [Clostridiales bacterium]|nr:cation-translocating P-type ATPase [Clostridiales bacterium]MCM1435747.1 cation-translocating P-type ATPase [Ruminococcus flavefaciens]
MNYFNQDAENVLRELGSDREKGLTTSQADESRIKNGENAITEEKTKSIFMIFLEQFADLLVVILIIASIISMISGEIGSTIVILVVLIMNAILGTVQHIKAQKSLNSLKAMSSPSARVIRNGVQVEIPASEVVVGDILLIEAGNVAAADGRLLEAASLQVNESALTGESLNVVKSSDKIEAEELALGDRVNMIYSGSNISNGRGTAVVTAVGMNTEIGKIASLMQNAKKKKTPLQVSLDKFSKILSIAVIAICIAVFLMTYFINKQPVVDALMFAVALAVAAIPEALSSIITISLAIGTQKMSKQKAIIKDLKAVEGLGCVSIICSDKTGTLTQNKMTMRDLNFSSEAAKDELILAMALCNDAAKSDDGWLGDPTETALSDYLGNDEYVRIREENPRVDEIPFDSDRKLMTTVHIFNDSRTAYTKGAVDVLVPRLKFILADGGVRPINDDDIRMIKKANLNYSENGMRVLSFAKKTLSSDKPVGLEDECDYIFIGLTAMTDPPREESKAAVAECISAGIKPIMITGDHKLTAVAIAKEIGIYKDGDLAMDGSELDKISDEELSAKLEKVSVYARVSPVHKIRIVELWQKKDMVVSMTGDGVNDAPALKKADVGVAMGITGTEVSKDAASMILADDNFATIVKAVANGRCIYSNIKNAIKFLLAGNAAAILVVILTTILNLPLPFMPVHLLFINLLTDSLPALALCMEPMQDGVMNEKPRSSKESILNKETGFYILFHSVIIAACVMTAFMIGRGCTDSAAMASTMAFGTLCLARLFEGFDSRGKYSLAKLGFTKNMFSIAAFCLGAVLLVAVLMIAPFHGFMSVSNSFTAVNLAQMVGLAVIPFALTQILRMIREAVSKK